jgi:membrane protease YdiL (CAAX protease family)
MEGGVQPVPWTPRQTFWWLLGGLLTAIIVPPLLVAPFDPKLKSDGALLVAQAIFDGILLAFAVGAASGWNYRRWRAAVERLGMRRFAPSGLALAFGVWIAYLIVAGLFAQYVLKPNQEDIGGDLGIGNPNVVVAVAAVLEIVVLAPIAEELFFRGFFFGGLRSQWSFPAAAITTGVIFGLVHAPTGPTAAIPLAGLGFALCFIYERTGSIWPCIAVHALNNGIALAVIH